MVRLEIVIHQTTSFARAKGFKRFDGEFTLTNRLRTVGIHYLIARRGLSRVSARFGDRERD